MLQNFEFCVPTRFIFGKGAEHKIGEKLQIMGVKKVLIHHDNGKFLFDSGLLDGLHEDLKSHGIAYCELGGVLPNPRLSLVYQGIEIARDEKADFILAIGGGSVIDSAKAIGIGAPYSGDVWDFFSRGVHPEKSLPVGVLLTLPATGSESSRVTVINNTDEKKKLLTSADVVRPAIVFMNPELTFSLPPFMTACGVVDMFSHTCERYFSPDPEIGVIDRMAEGILKTLVKVGPELMNDPHNYSNRAEVMWIGTIAHNDTVGVGRTQDWATHEIGNELSALYDTPHGATLSIIMGSWMRYVYKKDIGRFARYAEEVFDVTPDSNPEKTALLGIERTEEFFRSMKMPTGFSDFKIPTDGIDAMLERIAFRGEHHTIGGFAPLTPEDVRAIYTMASR